MRALKSRCSRTPLQMAVRGRFLVGAQPLSDDLVRRFILVAAESGIDIFRLHDPLNDVENIASAAAAVREAGCPAVCRAGLLGLHAEPAAGGREGPPAGGHGRRPPDPERSRGRARPGACDRVIGSCGRRPGSRSASTARARAATLWRWPSSRPGTAPSRSPPPPTRWPGRCTECLPRCCATRCPASASSTASTRTGCGRPRASSTSTSPRRCRHCRSRPGTRFAPRSTGCRWAGRRSRRPAPRAGRTRSARRGAGGVQAGADGLRHAAAGPAGGRGARRPGGPPRAVGPALGRGIGGHVAVPVRGLRHPAAADRRRAGQARHHGAAAARAARASTSCAPRATPPARRTCCWSPCSATTPAGSWPRCEAAVTVRIWWEIISTGRRRPGSAS